MMRSGRCPAQTHSAGCPLSPPSRAAQEQLIRDAYGPIADQIIPIQAPFLDLTASDYERLLQAIIAGWDAIQQIVATVPSDSEIEGWLRCAGGPVSGAEIGLSDAEIAQGIVCGTTTATASPWQAELDVGDRRRLG